MWPVVCHCQWHLLDWQAPWPRGGDFHWQWTRSGMDGNGGPGHPPFRPNHGAIVHFSTPWPPQALKKSAARIAKVGFGTKPASWILVWLRAHGSFPGFVLETPRRGRQKRKARSLGFCILYKVISWPGFVLSPTFWRKQSTMSGFVHLINGKRGV